MEIGKLKDQTIELRQNANKGVEYKLDDVLQIMYEILDHLDLLNERSDIMREVAEGHMVILRAEDVLPIDIHQKLRRDFVSIRRELLALEQAVDECNKGIITKNCIRIRQKMVLSQDDEYQRAIRPDVEDALRRAKETAWTPQFASKLGDISAGDPIVDRNSYNISSEEDAQRLHMETVRREHGDIPEPKDSCWPKCPMFCWPRCGCAGAGTCQHPYSGVSSLLRNVLLEKPHTFILDTTSGLNHTSYRVCKCGFSEFYKIHPREDTNAKNHQTGSQA